MARSNVLRNIDLWKHNWSFQVDEKGKIKVSLGNLTDAGWYWDGDENDLIGYLNRLRTSDVKKEFLSEMRKAGVPFSKLKEHLLKSAKKADGLYELSGDNRRWHFGESSEMEYDELNERVQDGIIPEDKKDEVLDKFWDVYKSETYDFDKWSKGEKKDYIKNVTEAIKKSKTYEDFFEELEGIEADIRDGLFDEERMEIADAMDKAQRMVLKGKTDMVAKEKWYKKAVIEKPPYTLGGWKKTQSRATRRRLALASRPKNWTARHRRLSAGRALLALANVTKDNPTKEVAKADATYFFELAKKNLKK